MKVEERGFEEQVLGCSQVEVAVPAHYLVVDRVADVRGNYDLARRDGSSSSWSS